MSGDLFTGTLELLILQVLNTETMHGYRIAHWIKDQSQGVLDVEQGQEVFILDDLSQRHLPLSFRYYDPIIRIT